MQFRPVWPPTERDLARLLFGSLPTGEPCSIDQALAQCSPGPYRPERFVVASDVALELSKAGMAITAIESDPDGSATITFEPVDAHGCLMCIDFDGDFVDTDETDGDADCDCPDCLELAERDWQRQRLISRLMGRAQTLSGVHSDALHPYGRCTCGGEGVCSWCDGTCQGCGDFPHDGPCEAGAP